MNIKIFHSRIVSPKKIVYNEIEMMKMKKTKRKKNTIILFLTPILIVLLLVVSLLFHQKTGSVEGVFKDIGIFLNKVVMFPFTSLNQEKNQTQSESLLIQKNANEALEKDIQELKETLELNKTLTEYTPINATVLSRNKSYWFNTITIDKGKSSGIKPNMAVITKNGLIGKVSKVSNHSSEVKLITSDDIHFKVSIAIQTNGVDNYAILNGFVEDTGYILATGIDKTTIINKGDLVVTSGLGELFPAGITIGTVEEMEWDKYNLSKTLYIKTYQNFHDIHYVTVLKVKE